MAPIRRVVREDVPQRLVHLILDLSELVEHRIFSQAELPDAAEGAGIAAGADATAGVLAVCFRSRDYDQIFLSFVLASCRSAPGFGKLVICS